MQLLLGIGSTSGGSTRSDRLDVKLGRKLMIGGWFIYIQFRTESSRTSIDLGKIVA